MRWPIAEPYAREIAGDWRGAASLWAELGCPYEQALSLADGDAEAMLKALALLEQLGARPAARSGAQTVAQAWHDRASPWPSPFDPNELGWTDESATGGSQVDGRGLLQR